MICPVCKRDMIGVEHHQIELDYCNRCGGAWFDSGELELLLNSANPETNILSLKRILESAEAVTAEKKRKCPRCNRKMKKVNIGHPNILIDACSSGEGLWFDGGEIIKLVKQLPDKATKTDDGQQSMVDFLAEVFRAQK